jgi:hypothetical protein
MNSNSTVVEQEFDYIHHAIRQDDRCKALAHGLRQLDASQLNRLHCHLSRSRPVVLDQVHYDEKRGLWCPLAIGLNVPEHARIPIRSERHACDIVRSIGKEHLVGFTLNPINRVIGTFYTQDRYRDLRALVNYLAFQQ